MPVVELSVFALKMTILRSFRMRSVGRHSSVTSAERVRFDSLCDVLIINDVSVGVLMYCIHNSDVIATVLC